MIALTRFSLETCIVSQGPQSRLFFDSCMSESTLGKTWLIFVPPPSSPSSVIFLSLELCWNHCFFSHVVSQVRVAIWHKKTCWVFFFLEYCFFPTGSICLSGFLSGYTNGCAGTMQGDCVVANEQLKAILLLNVTLDSQRNARDRCSFAAQ